MSHDPQAPEDPVLRALHALPREDLSAAALATQRERLHAELARVRLHPGRSSARWASGLEGLLLWLCGGCVLVRLGMSILLVLRAGM